MSPDKGERMKIGDRVIANKMPAGSIYTRVIGRVTGFKNGFVEIKATIVLDKWSTDFTKHPSSCALAARIEEVSVL